MATNPDPQPIRELRLIVRDLEIAVGRAGIDVAVAATGTELLGVSSSLVDAALALGEAKQRLTDEIRFRESLTGADPWTS